MTDDTARREEAAPELAEPVAYVSAGTGLGNELRWASAKAMDNTPAGTKLYAAPQAPELAEGEVDGLIKLWCERGKQKAMEAVDATYGAIPPKSIPELVTAAALARQQAEITRRDQSDAMREREIASLGLPKEAEWLLAAKDRWQDRAIKAEAELASERTARERAEERQAAIGQQFSRRAQELEATADALKRAVEEDRLTLFLRILDACGGRADASDGPNWIAFFCDDDQRTDTFNTAIYRGLIEITHDNRFDSSECRLTDAGLAHLGATDEALTAAQGEGNKLKAEER